MSDKVCFAVEQTSSGFRKLENARIKFPVFNVARSKTKLTQESPLIGRLIFERIEAYAQDHNIDSPKILVVGLGPIGNAVLQILKEEKFNTMGFDTEKSKGEIIRYLKDEKPDLIIGATGVALLEETDLDLLKNKHTYH